MAQTTKRKKPNLGIAKCPTGIPGFDEITSGGLPRGRPTLICGGPGCGKGLYRGSSILVSGTAGAGKTSVVAQAVAAACARGESCLYFAFEEASSQIIRNMQSIGIDLERGIKGGLLHFSASRPSTYGLEMHLSTIHRLTDELKPSIVVVDPVTNLGAIAPISEIKSMLTRLIGYFKMNHITAFFTSLTEVGSTKSLQTWGYRP